MKSQKLTIAFPADKDAGVRINVACALGAIGDTRAIEPLKNARRDSIIYVQSAAKEALRKIEKLNGN